MTQNRLYLSLTVTRNGQMFTLPLTPLLFAMWLMATYPTLGKTLYFVDQMMLSTDMIVVAAVLFVLSLVMSMEVKLCYS